MSWSTQMLGWFRQEMAFASRSNRCLCAGSEESCDRILIATVRSSRVSRARYTSPMPPAPSVAVISKGPSCLPGASRIGGRNYSPIEPVRYGKESRILYLTQENWSTREQLQMLSNLKMRYERLTDEILPAISAFSVGRFC